MAGEKREKKAGTGRAPKGLTAEEIKRVRAMLAQAEEDCGCACIKVVCPESGTATIDLKCVDGQVVATATPTVEVAAGVSGAGFSTVAT
jgi:hypothetical protein